MAFPWLLSPQERLDASLSRAVTAPAPRITDGSSDNRATDRRGGRRAADVHFLNDGGHGAHSRHGADAGGLGGGGIDTGAIVPKRHSRTANRRQVRTAAAASGSRRGGGVAAPDLQRYHSGAVEVSVRPGALGTGGGGVVSLRSVRRPPTPAMMGSESTQLAREPWKSPAVSQLVNQLGYAGSAVQPMLVKGPNGELVLGAVGEVADHAAAGEYLHHLHLARGRARLQQPRQQPQLLLHSSSSSSSSSSSACGDGGGDGGGGNRNQVLQPASSASDALVSARRRPSARGGSRGSRPGGSDVRGGGGGGGGGGEGGGGGGGGSSITGPSQDALALAAAPPLGLGGGGGGGDAGVTPGDGVVFGAVYEYRDAFGNPKLISATGRVPEAEFIADCGGADAAAGQVRRVLQAGTPTVVWAGCARHPVGRDAMEGVRQAVVDERSRRLHVAKLRSAKPYSRHGYGDPLLLGDGGGGGGVGRRNATTGRHRLPPHVEPEGSGAGGGGGGGGAQALLPPPAVFAVSGMARRRSTPLTARQRAREKQRVLQRQDQPQEGKQRVRARTGR